MNNAKKPCTVCGVSKSLDDFPNNKRIKSGKASRCKKCAAAYAKEYSKNRPYKYVKPKTPKAIMDNAMRSGMRRGLIGDRITTQTFSKLGYTPGDLAAHLEGLFEPGMTWGNYGEWHIDHKIPLAVLDYETTNDIGFMVAWDIENLQPLWASDNLSKGAKVDPLDLAMIDGFSLSMH